MNHNDDYFPLSYNDNNHPLQKWRLHSNSMHSQPLIKIDFDHKPKMVYQLPDVFMTSRQNQQKQSFCQIPNKSRKASKVSLNSLEVSPKIPKLNKSKDSKYKELSELHKSYCQFKKSLNQVKKQHLIIDNNCEINTINPNSSFYLNGVKLQIQLTYTLQQKYYLKDYQQIQVQSKKKYKNI